jgi:hypothetical protein
MKIIYTKGWFRRQKKCLEEFSKEKAQNLYAKRQSFSVVIEKDDKPFCFIDFNNKFVYVGFLDVCKRNYLSYEFWEYQSNRIFLKEVYFWKYESETDNKLASTHYKFTPEGDFGIENRNNITKEVVRKYAENKIDVSVLWENYPEFGEFNDITKIERKIPLSVITLSPNHPMNELFEEKMYNIYIGNTNTESLKLLFTLDKERHNELFEFIKSNNIEIKILNEFKCYKDTINLFNNEIKILIKELEYINEIKNMDFPRKLREACNEALENDLELICSGE